jgi:peptidoglycan/xylan/chitin deacetylase (PgdA/CDA1 family)
VSQSAFVISLDFEQHWGVYDHSSVNSYRRKLDGGRRAIPQILERFEAAGIHASWATVGLLLCEGREDALAEYPNHPAYHEVGVRIHDVIKRSGDSETDDPYHYALSLVQRIAAVPGQEIATHTFSHYYCLEQGPSTQDFEKDLEAAKRVASRHGIDLTAIVFPRNQYSSAHLAVCRHQGIKAFRGNPKADPYLPRNAADTSRMTRLTRLLDAYVKVVPSDKLLSDPSEEEGIINVPASRFLRPVSRLDLRLSGLRLRRIRAEMTRTAQQGADYHLWWHPHNFGTYTEENLALLDAIVEHYQELRESYGMASMTITEAATSRLGFR